MQPKNKWHFPPHTYIMYNASSELPKSVQEKEILTHHTTCDTVWVLSQRFLEHSQKPRRHTELTCVQNIEQRVYTKTTLLTRRVSNGKPARQATTYTSPG